MLHFFKRLFAAKLHFSKRLSKRIQHFSAYFIIYVAKWLSADRLDSVDWLPADVTIIPRIAGLLKASAL